MSKQFLAHITVELSYIQPNITQTVIDKIIDMWRENGFTIVVLDNTDHILELECKKDVENTIEIVKNEMKNIYDFMFNIPDSVKINDIGTSIDVG
jgi:hypothetical protein